MISRGDIGKLLAKPTQATQRERDAARPLLLAIQRYSPTASAAPVSDLIEEIAVSPLGDGGQVTALDEPPGGTAARLRFPLTGA
jgi:hypothetical protein